MKEIFLQMEGREQLVSVAFALIAASVSFLAGYFVSWIKTRRIRSAYRAEVKASEEADERNAKLLGALPLNELARSVAEKSVELPPSFRSMVATIRQSLDDATGDDLAMCEISEALFILQHGREPRANEIF